MYVNVTVSNPAQDAVDMSLLYIFVERIIPQIGSLGNLDVYVPVSGEIVFGWLNMSNGLTGSNSSIIVSALLARALCDGSLQRSILLGAYH